MDENLNGQPLRVALFTDADVFAGTERHLMELAHGLKASGVEVSVACPARSPVAEQAQAEGMLLIPIEKGALIDFRAIAIFHGLLRSGAIDILHAHNGRTALLAAIAKALARKGRVIATQHFLSPAHRHRTGLRGTLSRMAHRWVHHTVDHFVAISHASRHAMLEHFAAGPEKISVVHNGIAEPNRRTLQTREAIRARLGITDSRLLLVCAARLEPEKDIGTLLEAVWLVSQASPNMHCAIAGEGSERLHLEECIQRLGLADSVTLLGFVPDTLSLINAGDLFVLPSLAEPFGLALLEAMALGKPVISTRAGGPLEIVLDRITGLLVSPGNPRELADAILKLFGNLSLAWQMGAKGKERFRQKFSLDYMTSSLLAVYTQRP